MSYGAPPPKLPRSVPDHTTVKISIIDVSQVEPAGNPSAKWERQTDEVFTFVARAKDQAAAIRLIIAQLNGLLVELRHEENQGNQTA